MAEAVAAAGARILAANGRDVYAAQAGGLPAALLDRLGLDERRLEDIVRALREIAQLADPVGEITRMWRRPNGLLVGRMRIPLGVIAILYEARPNVTAEAAGLCVK